MTIISRPSGVSFSGNLVPFRIMAYLPVTFTLSCDGTEVLSQKYVPDSEGMVEIDLRPVVEDLLSFQLQDTIEAYEQPYIMREFEADIDGSTCSFTVLRGGVDSLAETVAEFLSSHFLTWQPSTKAVTYSSPEFLTYYAAEACSVMVKASYTDDSGAVTSTATVQLCSLAAGKVATVPVRYSVIAGKAGNFPAYYDVWVEDGSGNALTEIQRYYADIAKSTDEDWVLFENSLGGIDCFRAYGPLSLDVKHGHNTVVSGGEVSEYRIDTERLMRKETGVLGRREALWLLDFFPSLGKYIYTDGAVRRITVTDSTVSGKLRREPLSFAFTFRYADVRPYLNLPYREVPATMLDITVPDVGSFHLPPRLSEFPRLEPGEGVLIPAQSSSGDWGVLSWAHFLDLLRQVANDGYLPRDGDGYTPYGLDAGGTVTARRIIGIEGLQAGLPYSRGKSGAFISGQGNADLASILLRDFISSTLFREGFFGEGFKLWNDNGVWKMTVDQLTVRQIMRVYELVINKIRAVGGTLVVSPASGKIKAVADDGYNYRITFEKDNDAFVLNDLVRMQVWTGEDVASGGDGLVSKGYWIEVNGCGYNADGEQWITVSKNDEGMWAVPSVGDEVVQMGNTVDTTRQGLVVISAAEGEVPKIEILGGCDSRDFEGKLKVRLGGLDDITDADFPEDDQPQGDGLYANNVYLKGRFVMANGQDVMTYFTVQEGLFRSVIGNAAGSVMTSRDNYLYNGGFANGLDGWQVAAGVIYFTDSEGNWLFANGSMLSHVTPEAEVGDYMGIPTVHILNGSISQRNRDMQRLPRPITNVNEKKEAVPIWLTFHYKVNQPGTLKLYMVDEDPSGFETYTPFAVERTFDEAMEGYELFSCTGFWSGTGDFVLSFSGDINIYGITLYCDNEWKYSTLIEQTEQHILLEAQARSALGERVASLEITADKITTYVGDGTMASAVTQTVSGLDIMADKVVISGTGDNKVYLDTTLSVMQAFSTELSDYIDDAFRDSVISESEANEIGRYLMTLQLDKQVLDSQYDKLHSNLNSLTDNGDTTNALYTGMISAHTDLTAKKGAVDTSYTSLVSAIQAAVTAYGNLSGWEYNDSYTENQNQAAKLALETAASDAYTAMSTAFGTFKTALGDFATSVEAANLAIDLYHKAYADAAIATVSYLKDAMEETTIVSGGLMLTSAVVLGRKVSGAYTAYAGVSGMYDTTLPGNGIAFWAGGEMGDYENRSSYSNISRWAQAVVRFDGSGYLSGGNLSWDDAANISLTGTIHTGNGTIGGMEIDSSGIGLHAAPDITYGGWSKTTRIEKGRIALYADYWTGSDRVDKVSSSSIVINPSGSAILSVSCGSFPLNQVGIYIDGDLQLTGKLLDSNGAEISLGGSGHTFNSNQFSVVNNEVSLANSFTVTGTITAYNFSLSDERLKDIEGYIKLDVRDIARARSIIYTSKLRKDLGILGGVIAQDWLKTAPWALGRTSDGYLTVSYSTLSMPCIIECAREIVRLWEKINELEDKLP